MDDLAGWARYRTGTWHAHAAPAWKGDGYRSFCGHSIRADPSGLRQDPGGRRCRSCVARLERRRPRAHRAGERCACEDCRAHRRQQARAFLDSIELPGCRCVHEWDAASEIVLEASVALYARLFAWETAGGTVEARDVEDALRGLRHAWREAARRYDLLDGSHPPRESRR